MRAASSIRRQSLAAMEITVTGITRTISPRLDHGMDAALQKVETRATSQQGTIRQDNAAAGFLRAERVAKLAPHAVTRLSPRSSLCPPSTRPCCPRPGEVFKRGQLVKLSQRTSLKRPSGRYQQRAHCSHPKKPSKVSFAERLPKNKPKEVLHQGSAQPLPPFTQRPSAVVRLDWQGPTAKVLLCQLSRGTQGQG